MFYHMLCDKVKLRFQSFLNRYAVPETPFSVPVKVGSQELNELISSLLPSNGMYWCVTSFDVGINWLFKFHVSHRKPVV